MIIDMGFLAFISFIGIWSSFATRNQPEYIEDYLDKYECHFKRGKETLTKEEEIEIEHLKRGLKREQEKRKLKGGKRC